METIKLNDLDYSVLAILLDRELSGYDVTQRLKHFRKTSHPRVYSSLAKLELLSYVVYRDVPQKGKPDKKLYKLTTEGIETLRVWVSDERNVKVPKLNDEDMIRLLCLHLLDNDTVIRQLEVKRSEIEKHSQKILTALEQKQEESKPTLDNPPSTYLIELIRTHIDFDILVTEWLAATVQEKDGKQKQSIREYIKENL